MSKKITDLTELTTGADDDLLVIVDASEGVTSAKTKKIKLSSLSAYYSVVNSSNFDAYDSGFTYLGGTTYYVDYNNNIYKFISGSDQTNVTPGTNGAVWQITSAGAFAHEKNKDQYLDLGGGNEVAVADILLRTGARPLTADWTIGNFTLLSGNANVIQNSSNANNYLQTASAGVILNSNTSVGIQAVTANVGNNSDNTVVNVGTTGTNVVTIGGSSGVVTMGATTKFNTQTATRVPYLDASKNLVSSAVTPTELGYLSGVTSGIQSQLDTKNGYTLQASSPQFNPSDATTYFCGFIVSTVASTGAQVGITIPKAGTLKRVDVVVTNSGTTGSNETSTVYFRLNDTTDTTINSSVVTNAVRGSFSSGVLSVAVTAGDYFEIKWTTPSWATNPTNIRFNAIVYIE